MENSALSFEHILNATVRKIDRRRIRAHEGLKRIGRHNKSPRPVMPRLESALRSARFPRTSKASQADKESSRISVSIFRAGAISLLSSSQDLNRNLPRLTC